MRIALDLEGPCSNVHEPARERSDILEPHHFDEWKAMDDNVYKEYMHVSSNLWHNHWEQIPLSTESVPENVDRLRESNEVKILTARTGVDDQIQQWLDSHGVTVDGFWSTRQPKEQFERGPEAHVNEELQFDIFIDDNPRMVGEVDHLFLYDRPWNQSVTADGVNTIRVEDLGEVADMVEDGILVRQSANA